MNTFTRLLLLAALLASAAQPARARIETEAAPAAEEAAPILRLPPLTAAQAQPLPPTSVVVEQLEYRAPAPFPGGCFNCSTLGSNQDNVGGMLSRAHGFSQNLYGTNVGKKAVFVAR
jgi:hypothetical protein